MNQYRSRVSTVISSLPSTLLSLLPLQKFFRRRNIKDLLPGQPVKNVQIDPWWLVHVGYITEDDIRVSHTHLSYYGRLVSVGKPS